MNCFRDQTISVKWKDDQMVLFPKGMTERSMKYRSICLKTVLGNLLDQMLKSKLECELERKGGLTPKQFGFTKGRSTGMQLKVWLNKIDHTD